MKRLAIITTHPIQYNAPLFGLLAQQKNRAIKVFYTFPQAAKIVEDKGFGKKIEWDIPLLSGYDYSFVENTAKTPSLLKFNGIHNPTLIQEIENWKADAVLVYGWNFRSHLAAMRHFKGKIHVLFRGDSTLLDEKPNVRTLLRRLWLKFVFQYVDTALYTGTHNKEYYLKHGLLPHQLHFAPHAIDNQRFEKFDPQFLENWKQILNILPQNEQITLLFAGKFESKKNPALLIEAVKQFGANTFFLIMVGSGELESELKKMVENMPNVVFLPFQNQQKMPYTYRLADVYVLPSSGPNETWGLAVNEAMAWQSRFGKQQMRLRCRFGRKQPKRIYFRSKQFNRFDRQTPTDCKPKR